MGNNYTSVILKYSRFRYMRIVYYARQIINIEKKE